MLPRAVAFVDTNVLVKGMSAQRGSAKAVLILGTHGFIQITTSDVVRDEAEGALRRKGIPLGPDSEYAVLLRKLCLRFSPAPSKDDVDSAAAQLLPACRHLTDVAVIVSAEQARPDWLVSENERHFNPEVARVTGLRIVTPLQLLEALFVPPIRRSDIAR